MSGQIPMLNYVLTAIDTSGDTTWSSPGGVSGWTITNLTDVYETSSGNVGIGTTITNAGAALSVMNGNVGIGTWVPRGKLDVEGTLSISTFGGNVGIGTWVPIVPLTIPGYQTQSSAKFGGFEVQSYAVNNSWWGENYYYDGTNFRYRTNGYANKVSFNSGGIQFETAPSGTAGNIANSTPYFRVNNTGGIGIRLSIL